MNRAETTDLLYLVRRLWPTTTPITDDDITAALLVLAEVDASAAVAAVVTISKDGGTFPPPVGAIYKACRPARVGPERIPFELEEAPPVDHDQQLQNLARVREITKGIGRKVPPVIEGGAA